MMLHVNGVLLNMTFHPLDPYLPMAHEVDNITYVVLLIASRICGHCGRHSVFDWSKRTQLTTLHNGNPKGTTITSVQFINQDVSGLILVSSIDEMVKLYRNYDPATSDTPVQMASAYRGLNDIICLPRGSALSSTGTRWEGSYTSRAIRASCMYGTHTPKPNYLISRHGSWEKPVTTLHVNGAPQHVVPLVRSI